MTEFTDTYSTASKSFRAVLTASLRRQGLHLGQHLLLAMLAEQDGQTPGEIAARLHVTTPTIVKMLNRMVTTGLVERSRDDRDNRLVRIHLTEAGRSLVGPLEKEMADIEEALTAGLSERDRRTFLRLLERVTDNARALLEEWHVEVGE
jgi:DNA-binding MarR family transcriptional regulator